jgi:transposase
VAAVHATATRVRSPSVIEPYVERVVVANPLHTRAIAEAKVKTDKVDAEVLAQLLRCDYLLVSGGQMRQPANCAS